MRELLEAVFRMHQSFLSSSVTCKVGSRSRSFKEVSQSNSRIREEPRENGNQDELGTSVSGLQQVSGDQHRVKMEQSQDPKV